MQFVHELVIDPLDATWVVLGIAAGVAVGFAFAKLLMRRNQQ